MFFQLPSSKNSIAIIAVGAVVLVACSSLLPVDNSDEGRVPIDVAWGISDLPCNDVGGLIVEKLKRGGVEYKWLDKTSGLLQAGPLKDGTESGSGFSVIYQMYFLKITCFDELTTRITLEATLLGLDASEAWVPIVDVDTAQKYGTKFMDWLDL